MLLFLDVDGVLHGDVVHEPQLLLAHLPALESVLRARQAVEVVISSTWRLTRTLDELRALFSADIARRIISVTPQWRDIQDDATWGTYVREAEIEAWLRTNGRVWEKWVALDDQRGLFRPFCKNLIQTCPATGLDDTTVAELLKRLE